MKYKQSFIMTALSQTERRQLGLFRRQYLQLMSLELLAMPPSQTLRKSYFQAQLYEQIYSPGSLPYVITSRYKLRVLKELVSRIEGSIVDPEEDVRSPYITFSDYNLEHSAFS